MARPNVIGEKAKAANMTVIAFVTAKVKEAGGVTAAALALGVNMNALRYHLRKANLRVVSKQTVELKEAQPC